MHKCLLILILLPFCHLTPVGGQTLTFVAGPEWRRFVEISKSKLQETRQRGLGLTTLRIQIYWSVGTKGSSGAKYPRQPPQAGRRTSSSTLAKMRPEWRIGAGPRLVRFPNCSKWAGEPDQPQINSLFWQKFEHPASTLGLLARIDNVRHLQRLMSLPRCKILHRYFQKESHVFTTNVIPHIF